MCNMGTFWLEALRAYRIQRISVRFPLILKLIIWKHLVWAACIFFDTSAMHITAFASMPLSGIASIGILVGSSCLALVPFYVLVSRTVMAMLFVPQSVLMYVSALGALRAVLTGTYGDGVQHPHLFILADQCIYELLAYYHTIAVVKNAQER